MKVAVSRLGFGAAPIGNLYREISDEEAFGAVEAAWQTGVRYFDTAPHYGLGLSERRFGVALAGSAARRVRDLHQGRAAAGAVRR